MFSQWEGAQCVGAAPLSVQVLSYDLMPAMTNSRCH